MSDAKQVVRDFCAAWERMDKDAILDAFTDDAVYHNMPMQPATGKAQIKPLLDFILTPAVTAVTFDIKHMASDGHIVLTERVDTFHQGGKSIVLDVMGTFEVRDGKIAAWRDFFDMAQWTRQTTG